jgi:hypothetical protein
MNEYLIRKATAKDHSFLADTVIAAEKGMSDKLSYSTLFNLPEAEVKQLIISMFDEEIDGCEFSTSSFLVVEYQGQPVAALGGWIECFDGEQPSKILKSNLISYTFSKESIEFLKTRSHLVKDILIERQPMSLQYEYLYVCKDHLGKDLDKALVKKHEENALMVYPEVEKSQTQLFKNNLFSIKSLLKQGFQVAHIYKADNKEIIDYLPSAEKYLLEKKIKKTE